MVSSRQIFMLFSALAVGLASGCGFAPSSHVATVQAQNQALAQRTRAQAAEIENLRVHNKQVEDHLIQAEQQLAQLDEKSGLDPKQLASYKKSRQNVRDQAVGLGRGPALIPPGISGRLADLSRRYPSLQWDPETGVSKLDSDVLFDSGEAELKPAAERVLNELAAILQAPEAKDLKIMIVGHTDNKQIKGRDVRRQYPDNWHLSTARATAVAELLHKDGVAPERTGVAGFAGNQPISPNDTALDRRRNRRVEIFVVPPETPIVGWTETTPSIY